ncbi:MAG: MoaD/ThiS family protein, partial [Deltaproteobacteria bacterium]|nr:MoaD/ThiS family protein [Candidatus Tharpella sp.]
NREILIADKYVDIQLKDGDTLEIIQFVGGG